MARSSDRDDEPELLSEDAHACMRGDQSAIKRVFGAVEVDDGDMIDEARKTNHSVTSARVGDYQCSFRGCVERFDTVAELKTHDKSHIDQKTTQ